MATKQYEEANSNHKMAKDQSCSGEAQSNLRTKRERVEESTIYAPHALNFHPQHYPYTLNPKPLSRVGPKAQKTRAESQQKTRPQNPRYPKP